jgi:hypothetical protein
MLGVMFCSWIRIMIYESHHMWGTVVCSVTISSVFFGYLTQENSSRLYKCLCNCFGGCQIVCMLLILCALMDVLCTSVRYWLSIEQTSCDIVMKLRDYLSLQDGYALGWMQSYWLHPVYLRKGNCHSEPLKVITKLFALLPESVCRFLYISILFFSVALVDNSWCRYFVDFLHSFRLVLEWEIVRCRLVKSIR